MHSYNLCLAFSEGCVLTQKPDHEHQVTVWISFLQFREESYPGLGIQWWSWDLNSPNYCSMGVQKQCDIKSLEKILIWGNEILDSEWLVMLQRQSMSDIFLSEKTKWNKTLDIFCYCYCFLLICKFCKSVLYSIK